MYLLSGIHVPFNFKPFWCFKTIFYKYAS